MDVIIYIHRHNNVSPTKTECLLIKKLFIAVAVLSAMSAAHAAPTGSAYDRIQDSAISGLQKQDRTQELRIDGLVQVVGDHQTAINDMYNKQGNFVTKPDYDADRQTQEVRDNKQDILIQGAHDKADTALDGVVRNGQDIISIKQVNDVQDSLLNALENAPKPVDGKDGKDGVNGINGTNGIDGKNGADGKDGLDGAKGDKGDTGAAGRDGTDGKYADMSAVNANTAGVKSLQQRAADLDIRIAQQKADQAKTNSTVAAHTAQLADREKRISSLESQTNARFSEFKNQIDDNKRNADAGIAGVAAMANIPQVTESQTFAIGAGVGTREGESAIAVGFSARASQNVVVKASVAGDTQQSWTVGAGVSYGW